MSDRPLLVTGHGRSGTHWLAHVLGHFVEASHEPERLEGDVVVDCRLVNRPAQRIADLREDHEVMHLVRDGRDVVRSAHEYYSGTQDFAAICRGWADATSACRGLPFVRLEDLLKPQAASPGHRLSHWTEWPPDLTRTFWSICGPQMQHYGYHRDEDEEAA